VKMVHYWRTFLVMSAQLRLFGPNVRDVSIKFISV